MTNKSSKIPEDIYIGKLINFNFIYSNESFKLGIVCSVNPDSNFNYMVNILCANKLIRIPYSIMEIKEIE